MAELAKTLSNQQTQRRSSISNLLSKFGKRKVTVPVPLPPVAIQGRLLLSGWGGGGGGTRPWWLALLACGGAYWPLAFEPSAMTSRHPHCRGHPPSWVGSRMQLLPMASSLDGLISARYAVITKTPGWEVLTTTSNVNVTQGHGC